MGRPLKIAKAQAVLTITDTTAATDTVTVSQDISAPPTGVGIIAGMPFVVASNVGGLTANTTYWVLEVIDANNFTVSATDLSANRTRTPVSLSDTTSQTVSASVGVVDAYFNNPNGGAGFPATNANTYSVVGGNTAIIGPQVLARVAIAQNGVGTITVADDSPNITGVGTDFANTLTDGTVITTADGTLLGYVTDIANANATFATFAANSLSNATNVSFVFANNEAGFIVRQKGKQKYLVQGTTSGLVGACFTANLANADLYPGTMNIVGTYANAATENVQSLSDHNAELFTATSGITALPNETANINNSSPAYSTFNTAYDADTYGGQPYPIVTISNA
jgi:hypothetical protein